LTEVTKPCHYQDAAFIKQYDGRINRHHLGIILWRLAIFTAILIIVVLVAKVFIAVTSIVLFIIGFTLLLAVVLITIGTIFILDPNHGKHWENLMVILQNNAAAQEVLTKALTFIPLVSAVSVVFNILAIVLLYTSKLPVRRYRVVTSIFLFIVNIVILIYFLAGGQGA